MPSHREAGEDGIVAKKTRRRSPVAVLAVLSGVAIAVGSLLDWIAGRDARPTEGLRHTAITGLFHWRYDQSASFLHSFAVVMLACGVLVLLGGLFASRLLTGLFSALAIAAGGLWIGLNASHYKVGLPYSDLRVGAWLCLVGGLVGLLSAFILRGKSPAAPALNPATAAKA
jgi:hypothetical protein